MTQYDYTNKTIDDIEALTLCLKEEGANFSTTSLLSYDHTSGALSIESELSQTKVDDAVTNSLSGSLFSRKLIKKKEIRAKTQLLVDEGVSTWSTGDSVKLTQKTANGYYEDWDYLTGHSSKISVSQPYVLTTLYGDEISTTSLTDIQNLADRAADRWSYLIDGQKDLTDSIDAAANQTALDAITDGRT